MADDRIWLPLRPLARRSGIAAWLAERGSLTRRLRRHCGAFSLQRLAQGRQRLHPDQRGLLGGTRSAWGRQVLLLADGVPVVYAHSVADPRALRGRWRLLRALGGRPVGDAVFARASTRRGVIRVRQLRPGHPLQCAACRCAGLDQHTRLWARRSAFVDRGQALWVTEVFLPAMAGLEPRACVRRSGSAAPSRRSAAPTDPGSS